MAAGLRMPAGAPQGAVELKQTGNAEEICGMKCTLYTASGLGEAVEIWATGDAALFPFRVLEQHGITRRFGLQMLADTWPELLRGKSLFPLRAILKTEPGGHERLSFRVEAIERKEIGDDTLFLPPDKHLEIQPPSLPGIPDARPVSGVAR